MIIVGVPMSMPDGSRGAVFIYQSLEAIADATEHTKELIFLAAFIAIVMTTFFCLFLVDAHYRSAQEDAPSRV